MRLGRMFGGVILAALWTACSHPHKVTSTFRSFASATVDASGYLFNPTDTSCDGFPRVKVGTMPGTCLGLVLTKTNSKGLVKPRTIQQIPGTKNFLVVDMGGWADNKGALYLMSRTGAAPYKLTKIKDKLNQPHGFKLSSDGFYYIGEKNRISRFRYQNGVISEWQVVLNDIKRGEGYMHPLAQFTFDPRNNDLYINSGSPSDHCSVQGSATYKYCPESEQQGTGTILRIPGTKLKNLPAGGVKFFEIVATGLRNSMAIAVHPSGTLVQGENSRDFPELEEPYEELNVIDLNDNKGFHFGWPYCYNFHALSPEWNLAGNRSLPIHQAFKMPVDCSQTNPTEPGDYQAPYALMPPHVAPLHMDYYKSPGIPALNGKLLVAWHGYQPTGHRLVSYVVDSKGRPKLQSDLDRVQYRFNQKGAGVVKRLMRPNGGLERHAPYDEVISQWSEVKGVRPKGSPVGFTVADDGSIYIVEDRANLTVVRLAKSNITYQDPEAEGGDGMSVDPKVELLAWRHHVLTNPVRLQGYAVIQNNLINKNCLGCHGNMQADDIANDRFKQLDFIVKNDWIKGGAKDESKLYGAIARLPAYTPMPPIDKPQFHNTPAGQLLIKQVGEWIDGLTPDITKSFTRIVTGRARQIREATGLTAKVCGQFQAQDVVYVDPRDSERPVKDGFVWTKVYLVPGHTRLVKGACAAREDGVYWMDLVKR